VKFFFDNNLSPKLAKSLDVLVEPERQVFHLKNRFAADTPDEDWMKQLSYEQDWVIVSGDVRITKNEHELAAWRAAGHTTFFLKKGWVHIPFWEQVQKFVKCFPSILEKASRAERGSLFFVTVKGKIEG